ncbi:DUF4114 domain-containing protein [Roseivirga pacifica]|uniref:DUF4114 domain-containing protein n=1 Tax=Roseivirga pacifica TaxID=1267423 RepID=UPI003BB0A0CB
MKKTVKFILLLLFVGASCKQSDIDPILEENGVDVVELSKSFSSVDHVNIVNQATQVNALTENDLNVEDEYYWTHIAEVAPLELNGETLSASSISLHNNIAYVTYHKRGNVHLGALELINLSDPDNPSSLGFIPFEHADINAVTVDPYEEGTIWIAGSSNKIGAALYKLQFTANSTLISSSRINLSKALNGATSASANGIFCTLEHVYVSAGKSNGGVFRVNKTNLRDISVDEFYGAKGIAGNNVQGIDYFASLAVSDVSTIKIQNELTDDVQFIEQGVSAHQTVDLPHDGKYELQFSPFLPNELYYTSASNGVQSIDIVTGSVLKTTDPSLLPKGNTNGLYVDEEFIFLANGEDGLSIALLEDAEQTNVISPLFQWDLPEKPASVNFVTAQDGYIFVAKGLGGFHVLKYEEQNQYKTVLPYDRWGTPIGMKNNEYCPDVIQNVLTKALPEGQNAIINTPEYFQNPNSSFFLEREAQVEITFLHEGAGFRNTLGYYTYNVNNPPASVDDLDKTIIFPNASAVGSGGGLEPGNTVEVLGTFPAGTVFGFYLVSYGWRHELTDGYYTQYSDWTFNQNGLQQNLIFYDQSCDAFVVCFEDILIPGGDKDFNDAIFQVTSTPSEAFKKTAYLQIR